MRKIELSVSGEQVAIQKYLGEKMKKKIIGNAFNKLRIISCI